MNKQTQEALKMAMRFAKSNILTRISGLHGENPLTGQEVFDACKEALASHSEALEKPITRDWKETIDERIARDSEFKEALEQSEIGDAEIRQMLNDIEYYQKRVEELEQPAQEPVAWIKNWADGSKEIVPNNYDGSYPVYTHPHQVVPTSTWQGLTDDEIAKLWKKFETELVGCDIRDWTRVIEKELKTKNGFSEIKEKNHGN